MEDTQMGEDMHLTMWVASQPAPADGGDEGECDAFFGALLVNDVPRHITLVEVTTDDDGGQARLTDWGDNCLSAALQFESTAKAFQTIEHDGRHFVCVVTPYLV